jgi:hypothetical protein
VECESRSVNTDHNLDCSLLSHRRGVNPDQSTQITIYTVHFKIHLVVTDKSMQTDLDLDWSHIKDVSELYWVNHSRCIYSLDTPHGQCRSRSVTTFLPSNQDLNCLLLDLFGYFQSRCDQCRFWSDSTHVPADLDLYWLYMLIWGTSEEKVPSAIFFDILVIILFEKNLQLSKIFP